MHNDSPLFIWRKSQKLTQDAAGALFSLQQGTYSRYERGVDKPGIKTSVLIERLTGIPVQQLRPDIFPPPTKPTTRKRGR